jgi:hypothetical protein
MVRIWEGRFLFSFFLEVAYGDMGSMGCFAMEKKEVEEEDGPPNVKERVGWAELVERRKKSIPRCHTLGFPNFRM